MNFRFQDKAISGLLLVVPANERRFVDEMKHYNFPEARSLKLKEVMGYDRHRIVEGDVCTSDLVVHGFEQLFASGLLAPDDIDALILVTQTPDYFLPPTSSVIQGRLKLKQDMLCLDINQGCAGFVVGLLQAMMLLEQESIRRVAVVTADVLSRRVSPRDRNSFPLTGDAAAITLVERRAGAGQILANLKMDGTRHETLIIPAGGFRLPSSPATAVFEDSGDNNLRAKDHLKMEGSEVFNFVMNEVPLLIEELLRTAEVTSDAVDYFLCHQPNRFMLQKLADRLRVPHAKVPSNVVERYGNSNSATIPAAIALNLADKLKTSECLACLSGFGVGLTWSAMLLRLGQFRFCETVQYPNLP